MASQQGVCPAIGLDEAQEIRPKRRVRLAYGAALGLVLFFIHQAGPISGALSQGIQDENATLDCTYDLGVDWLSYHRIVVVEYAVRSGKVTGWRTNDQRPGWRTRIHDVIGW